VRIHFVGDRRRCPRRCAPAWAGRGATPANSRLVFNVCFNYGGRWDIAQAAQKLAARGEAITEQSLDRAMALAHVPDPDLLIRTGGELRISNFLLWQAAYSRAVFQRQALARVRRRGARRRHRRLRQRERRFGKTSAQVTGPGQEGRLKAA
jgi:undecaprenyl diphosphate synthase